MKVSPKITTRPVPDKTSSLPPDLHPVLVRILRSRGVHSNDALDLGLKHLYPPDTLRNCLQAARRLADAVQQHQRILIVGDYDTDGATSAALAVLLLRQFGATDVDFLLPDRFIHGYGLSPSLVAVASEHLPALIVTVDNGISSIAGVAAANAHGIDVIITDHHLPGEILPAAMAIVNPNLPGDRFGSKNLAGVGVVYYLLAVLRQELILRKYFVNATPPNLAAVLDLVAVGTVADLVTLDFNNRLLVSQGLARINTGRCRPGITALLEVAKRKHPCTTQDIAFAIGPRLNAAGRLQDMSLGVRCLLTDDPAEAKACAQRLEELNKERRALQATMQDQAQGITDTISRQQTGLPKAFCLYSKDWHEGLVGLIASRIKDRFHRPVVAFATADSGELKGSGRSIHGLHLRDLLCAVDRSAPGMITRFGGHAMAAGLSLPQQALAQFRTLLNTAVEQAWSNDLDCQVLATDGSLPADCFTLDFAIKLRDLAPWGQGFPTPCFEDCFQVIRHRIVGESHLKLMLQPETSTQQISAIYFNALEHFDMLPVLHQIRAVYNLVINDFNGRRQPELIIQHLQPQIDR